MSRSVAFIIELGVSDFFRPYKFVWGAARSGDAVSDKASEGDAFSSDEMTFDVSFGESGNVCTGCGFDFFFFFFADFGFGIANS